MDDTSCKDDEGNDDKESRGSKLKRKRGLEENEAKLIQRMSTQQIPTEMTVR